MRVKGYTRRGKGGKRVRVSGHNRAMSGGRRKSKGRRMGRRKK